MAGEVLVLPQLLSIQPVCVATHHPVRLLKQARRCARNDPAAAGRCPALSLPAKPQPGVLRRPNRGARTFQPTPRRSGIPRAAPAPGRSAAPGLPSCSAYPRQQSRPPAGMKPWRSNPGLTPRPSGRNNSAASRRRRKSAAVQWIVGAADLTRLLSPLAGVLRRVMVLNRRRFMAASRCADRTGVNAGLREPSSRISNSGRAGFAAHWRQILPR